MGQENDNEQNPLDYSTKESFARNFIHSTTENVDAIK